MSQPSPAPIDDPALESLRDLEAALEQTVTELIDARTRALDLIEARETGRGWREIVESERRPLLVETLSTALDRLSAVGGRFRRCEAEALHDEGLSMERIALLFGVTRQRVSALLKSPRN